ncbi:uncharacterized protein LOC113229803 [Hyposmocoma kahamanoa]|uniref:uncharacterized protein LOC113229803 n=1 Tax=Hyposmocoma kahamanoa TaxID=1477025 RepID=UPI000E6DA119|nr:uncharacterized protein LOC113229803 [Hyposmocoma kahamanoa]
MFIDLSGDQGRATPTKRYNTEALPQILPCEVAKALYYMKAEKSPGEDRITVELLCAEGKPAGFRSGFSTTDHIQTVKQLMEKYHEYNGPIVMTFVDYEQAFDSVEHFAVFHALYRTVRMHELTNPVPIKRGVWQGDIISPKLFTSVLQDVVKTLHWTKYGVNINGVFLSYLRFADDLVFFANDLRRMLQQLYDDSMWVGLKMNMYKTKVMANISNVTNPSVTVGSEMLEIVD